MLLNETQFAKYLNTVCNFTSKSDKKEDVRYVRCNASVDAVLETLNTNNVDYTPSNLLDTPISGADRFNNSIFIVEWKGFNINIKADGSGTKQKSLAPNRIIKVGHKYTSALEFKKDVISGLKSCDAVATHTYTTAVNLLSCIETGDPLELTEQMKISSEKSIINSDLGEVMLAYSRLLTVGGIIEFPITSNQSGFDFYHNGIPISAKSAKGSSRFLIAGQPEIVDKIDNINSSDFNKMFNHWHKREMVEVLDSSIPLCTQIEKFAISHLGGKITDQTLLEYVVNTTYEQMVLDIIRCQDGGKLGVPASNSKQDRTKSNYNNGSLHPVKFALLTIWERYIVIQNQVEFNKIATMLTSDSDIVFEYFDYCVDNKEVLIKNLDITKYSEWNIRYHANANSWLQNYPALVGIK